MLTEREIQCKTQDELASVVLDLQKKLSQKTQTIHHLYEQLKLSKHYRFGTKSEKHTDEEQRQNLLFDEAQPLTAEEKAAAEKADEAITIAAHERKAQGKKKGRKALPADLPREPRVHDLSAEEKICACGCELTCIGDERSEQLDIIPAKIYVIEHIHKKYACKSCEETIKQAKHPKQPIPKSIASPGLLAHTLVSKFEDHLPLYRQERMLQRIGVDLSRSTLSLWVLRSAALLTPLYKLLQSHIQQYDVSFADETPIQVLNEAGRSPQSKSYMWLFGGGPPDKPAWVYHYSPSRAHGNIELILEDFKGYLHCDGYAAYDSFANKQANVQLVGCWYHLRRKFIEAQKVSDRQGLATDAVRQIKKLAALEKSFKLKTLTPTQIHYQRQRQAKPLVTQFKQWLDKHFIAVPPKSLLGNAMAYALNQWPKLVRYLDDGRLDISNNRSERAIKPFVIGRKNWLFANSVKGANAAAVIFSIIQSCKANNIQPYDYLAKVLAMLPSCSTEKQLDELLPFNINLRASEK